MTLVRQELNPRLRISGIVLCMYEKGTRLAQEVLDDITQFLRAAQPSDAWHGAHVLQTRIRRTIKLAECPSFGQTVFDYAPASHGAEDYLALAREVLDGRADGLQDALATATAGAVAVEPAAVPVQDVETP